MGEKPCWKLKGKGVPILPLLLLLLVLQIAMVMITRFATHISSLFEQKEQQEEIRSVGHVSLFFCEAFLSLAFLSAANGSTKGPIKAYPSKDSTQMSNQDNQPTRPADT